MNNNILKYLHSIRQIKALSDFKVSFLRVNLLFLSITFILIIIESLFYLKTQNRLAIVTYTLSTYLIIHFYIIMRCYLNYKNLFNNSSNDGLPGKIEA